MPELKELIAEGEYIRSAVLSSLSPGEMTKVAWNTVTHWYSDGFAYAKKHSSRTLDDFPAYLDPANEKTVHFEQIDRLLNRLRALQSSESST